MGPYRFAGGTAVVTGAASGIGEALAAQLAARGSHLVAEDLIKVLDSGHLAHAYLDVFEHEPLPPEHPLWKHPAITITPHTAALTEPRTAIPKIVENIERLRRGQPPLNLVDLDAGY